MEFCKYFHIHTSAAAAMIYGRSDDVNGFELINFLVHTHTHTHRSVVGVKSFHWLIGTELRARIVFLHTKIKLSWLYMRWSDRWWQFVYLLNGTKIPYISSSVSSLSCANSIFKQLEIFSLYHFFFAWINMWVYIYYVGASTHGNTCHSTQRGLIWMKFHFWSTGNRVRLI